MQAPTPRNTLAEPVVISGAGLVTSLGLTVEETWQAILAGKNGIAPLTAVESVLSPNKGGGEAPPLAAPLRCDDRREIAYLRMAIAEALEHAGCIPGEDYPAHRCGVLLGTTLHGMRQAGKHIRTNEWQPLEQFPAGCVLRDAVDGFGVGGFTSTLCAACSSGLASIAMAITLLQTGQLDLVLSGGYDPISEYAYGGFNSMRLVTEGRIRNFCRDRDGMKLGEGYGIVVLERARDVAARGRKAVATVLGFGESCDAHHLSKPHPEGAGAKDAMAQALARAGVAAASIGMIAAHSTATPDNDAAEYLALQQVFGEQLPGIPVVAFKSYVGHTLGGAGAVELILSAMALRDKTVPPTHGISSDEVEFQDLHVATDAPRRGALRAVMNTSLGFGGANTCLVLGPPKGGKATPAEDLLRSGPLEAPRDPVITGIGVVLPGAVGNEPFVELLSASSGGALQRDTGAVPDEALAGLLNARRVRRMSDYVKLTLAATTEALRHANIDWPSELTERCAAVLGTYHGSTLYSQRYYNQIVEQGIDSANPMLFAEGVPNAAAAHLSTTFGLKGLCQTMIGTRTAGLEALALAAARIESGTWDRVLVGAADEYNPYVNEAFGQFGLYRREGDERGRSRRRGFFAGSGAVTLLLESREVAERRGASIVGRIVGTASRFAAQPTGRGGIDAVRSIWTDLGGVCSVVCSANDTWIERIERAGLRHKRSPGTGVGPAAQVYTGRIYGRIAECFSALPLAGLASVLLTGHLPISNEPGNRIADTSSRKEPDEFVVLGSDFAGQVIGVRVAVNGPR